MARRTGVPQAAVTTPLHHRGRHDVFGRILMAAAAGIIGRCETSQGRDPLVDGENAMPSRACWR